MGRLPLPPYIERAPDANDRELLSESAGAHTGFGGLAHCEPAFRGGLAGCAVRTLYRALDRHRVAHVGSRHLSVITA